jgi:hypothetical protein
MFPWWVQVMVNLCESMMNLEFILSSNCLKKILGFEWLKYFRVFHEVSQLVLIIYKLSLFWFENKGLQNAPQVLKVVVTKLVIIINLPFMRFEICHQTFQFKQFHNTKYTFWNVI